MLNKYVSLVLAAALLSGEFAVANASGAQGASRMNTTRQQTAPAPPAETASPTDEAGQAAEVKSAILKLGVGPDARVKLKLRDRSKVQGFISEAGADTFVVVNPKSGVATTVAYPQVGTAKGNNLSQGAKIAISVGISVALTILTYKYGRRRRRGIIF